MGLLSTGFPTGYPLEIHRNFRFPFSAAADRRVSDVSVSASALALVTVSVFVSVSVSVIVSVMLCW